MCPEKQPKWDSLVMLAIGMVLVVLLSVVVVSKANAKMRMRIEIYEADEPGTTIEEKRARGMEVGFRRGPRRLRCLVKASCCPSGL
jgi:hypothetical protein